MDIKPINDYTFVACSIIDIDFGIYKGYSSIRTIDIYGNQLPYWESEVDSEEGHLVYILPTPDSSFIACGIRLHQRNANTFKVQSSFMKFDTDFNLKWIKRRGKITSILPGLRMYDAVQGNDGNYISFGKTIVNPDGNGPYSAGWIYKFSPSGDSIWSRDIVLPQPYTLNDAKAIYAGGILSSGSIIGGGYAEINGAYFGWIVKLTADGCLDTLFACQTSPVREVIKPAIGGGLGIYPNPANDQVKILFPSSDSGGTLKVTDILGHQVFSNTFATQTRQIELAVADWETGIYIATIRTGNLLFSGKLLVKR